MNRPLCTWPLLAMALTLVGCFGGRDRTTRDAVPPLADAGARPIAVTPAECLPDVPCVNDSDCPSGHHCNFALSPSSCQRLFCGAPGTVCSESAQCQEGLECWDGLCTTCNGCGEVCLVDFASDRRHCGRCDNPVPPGATCVAGEIACPGGDTACGRDCVDLRTDPNHCGACGNRIPAGMSCSSGSPTCYRGDVLCGAVCIDPSYDDANCGGCGNVCPSNAECTGGQCIGTLSSRTRESCAAVCGAEGGTCVAGSANVICGSGFLPGAIGWDCTSTPPSSCNSSGAGPQPFHSISCDCEL